MLALGLGTWAVLVRVLVVFRLEFRWWLVVNLLRVPCAFQVLEIPLLPPPLVRSAKLSSAQLLLHPVQATRNPNLDLDVRILILRRK